MRIASELLPELLLAVLNSFWQAAVVAALVWAAVRVLPKVNAATRYAIWWAVLGVVLALPAAPRVVAWWGAWERTSKAVVVNRPAPARVTVPLIEDQPAMVTLTEARSARWPLWIAGLWAALGAYRLWQIGRSYVYLRGVKGRARLAPGTLADRPLEASFRLPEAASKRSTRLLFSEDVGSPMAVGFLHPAVILPESLPEELAQPEMEHVLLHEAAHIARRDDWSNLLAKLFGAALALHPVAWWVLRQIEREREIACDDWVVAKVGSARPYAESLARMSELRWARQAKLGATHGKTHGKTQGEALASGMFGGGSRLGPRIELLLERGREFSTEVSKVRVAMSGATLLGCLIAGAIVPKGVAFAQVRPAFSVASVKPEDPKYYEGLFRALPGGTLRARNATLLGLVGFAYRADQYGGGPGWLSTDRFAVEAKAADDFSQDPDGALLQSWDMPKRMALMLQTLLEDRFKLRVHWETKETTVYALVVAKGGARLQEVQPNDPSERCCWTFNDGQLAGRFRSMPWLADELRMYVHAPVSDETGLKGVYDFKLEWQTEANPDAKGPTSIFTAVQEELGLRLEARKGQEKILVIDHAEKPDAN
jgi:bla regulator protein blaR1